MKKILVIFLFLLQSLGMANTVVNDLIKILQDNNGFTAEKQIRFEFPWQQDQQLLRKIDHYVEQQKSEKSVEILLKITTSATDRLEIIIYGVLNKNRSVSAIIVKKNWRGIFQDQFSYKIIPSDYLYQPRPLGKIDKYELGFISGSFVVENLESKITDLVFYFPEYLGSGQYLNIEVKIQIINSKIVMFKDDKIFTKINLKTNSDKLESINLLN